LTALFGRSRTAALPMRRPSPTTTATNAPPPGPPPGPPGVPQQQTVVGEEASPQHMMQQHQMMQQQPPQQRRVRTTVAETRIPIFSAREHELFVEGVDMFCSFQSDAGAWLQIARHVRSRTPEEIKAHAMYYLMSLQSRNPDLGPPWSWTHAENQIFEAGLAQTDEGDPQRWDKIAQLLPHKTPEDVHQWYVRLLADLLDIERGSGLPSSYDVGTGLPSSYPVHHGPPRH